MPESPADLDATIAALELAVRADEREAVALHLAKIERHLQAMNPLLRGMTYAHVQSVLGKPDEAAAVVEDLLELMPEAGMAHYQLGCYRREAGDAEAALAAFTRATELEPERLDAWMQRGMLLDERGEPRRAVEAYRAAMLRGPTEVDVWRNLGNSLAALALFDEALEAYQTAASLRPNDETIAFLRASTHQAKGDLAAANALLTETQRRTLGEAVEVRSSRGALDLRCRYHVVTTKRTASEAAARGLLEALADELATASTEMLDRGDSFAVRRDDHWLLCDADGVRSGRPNRFFDATRIVDAATG
ncbi:MAG: tetratricopeptide repeat protein [Deltaproteobacteria bacterium]|nr:tetratricopeptide repeat protein [Deltaproteobacteria bacterium]